MRRQTDLRLEAANLLRFRSNFAAQSHQVSFPEPIAPWIHNEVLIETYEEGRSLGTILDYLEHGPTDPQVDPVDWLMSTDSKHKIGVIGQDMFLKMMVDDNFVHADLHPGNILVHQPGPDSPLKLIILDTGLVTELCPKDWRNFMSVFGQLATGNGRVTARLLIDHAPAQQCTDPAAFAEELQLIVSEIPHLALANNAVGPLLRRMLDTAQKHRVGLDSNFVSLMLAIAVLEGIGRQLSPSMSLFGRAIPHIVRNAEVRQILLDTGAEEWKKIIAQHILAAPPRVFAKKKNPAPAPPAAVSTAQ